MEKERFSNEYDLDKDGVLKGEEVRRWLIPDLYQVCWAAEYFTFEFQGFLFWIWGFLVG